MRFICATKKTNKYICIQILYDFFDSDPFKEREKKETIRFDRTVGHLLFGYELTSNTTQEMYLRFVEMVRENYTATSNKYITYIYKYDSSKPHHAMSEWMKNDNPNQC